MHCHQLFPRPSQLTPGAISLSSLVDTSTLRSSFDTNTPRQIRKQYEYVPLPKGRYFRLLQLLPGGFEDIISTELLTFDYKCAPPYEPISYVWGDQAVRR